MKKLILSGLLWLAWVTQTAALDASVSYCTFKSPDKNYIEIYLHVVGTTVEFAPLDSLNQQASVLAIILFKQDGKIVKFDKFNMLSPATNQVQDFIDIKRYALDNGRYTLEVTLEDTNRAGDARSFTTPIIVKYDSQGVMASDIQLLAGIEKSADEADPFFKVGYHLEPLPFHWYHKNTSQLFFYHEIYNADTAIKEPFYISYLILDASDTTRSRPLYMGHKRLEPAPIVPVLQSVDISKLPSGNYFLTVEVRNRAKEKLMQRSVSFQRSNPYLSIELADVDTTSVKEEFAWKLSAEELRFSLKAVAPRLSADAEAINTLLAGDNLQAQRLYLFAYWTKESPNYPEAAYRKYMEVARAVGDMFHSGFGNGVETDRGYIYLKYGRPDDMIKVEDEPSAPPYEIWSYNYFPTTKQNNVRFLFYNPSLSPGNFQLLHSTARGEINNPQWQLRLYRDAPTELNTPNFIDGTDLNDNFGRKAVRYFNDF